MILAGTCRPFFPVGLPPCGGEAHPGVGAAVLKVSAGVQREKDFVSVDQKQYYSELTDLPQSQIIAWEL